MDADERFAQFLRDEAFEILKFMEHEGRDDTNEAAREWIWSKSEAYKRQWNMDHT